MTKIGAKMIKKQKNIKGTGIKYAKRFLQDLQYRPKTVQITKKCHTIKRLKLNVDNCFKVCTKTRSKTFSKAFNKVKKYPKFRSKYPRV